MWMHMDERGPPDAPPVVCLHGVTGYGGRFGAVAERLPKHRLIALDARGHGRSGWEPPWNLETHVADASETITALGLTPALKWLGHSFGARLIIELEDALVERQVLLEPVVQWAPGIGLARGEEERVPGGHVVLRDALDETAAAIEAFLQ
jgi:lipase